MAHVTTEEGTDLVKQYYLEYARYVLETRALASIYDGLKFSQRRLLYVSSKLGMRMTKSSKILGDTIPYHPHGMDSLYGVLVGMTTNKNPYHLYVGKGNWGGVGFDAAAYRYTEAYLGEMARFNHTQFIDSADFYTGEAGLEEPRVLPTLIPYSLMVGDEQPGVGLKPVIMPLDVMGLIDYYIAVIRGEDPVTPDPDLGNFILDMDDDDIPRAVEGAEGKLTIKSMVSIESDSVVVVDDVLGNKGVKSLLSKMAGWLSDGTVDFRDESAERPRYVFEVMDPKITVNELAEKLSEKSVCNKTFKRIVIDGEHVVYAPLRYQVEKSLEYLNECLDRMFATELERLDFDRQVLLAIRAMDSSGLLRDLRGITTAEAKKRLVNLGFSKEVSDKALSKPIAYLTKSHDQELKDIEKRISDNKGVDRTEYLLKLYEDFRELIRPFYESSGHTVRRSKLLKDCRVSLGRGGVIKVSNRGEKYENLVYGVFGDGTGRTFPIGASVRRDIIPTDEGHGNIVSIVSDLKGFSVLVTNHGRAITVDTPRLASNRKIVNLDVGERVVKAFGVDEGKDGSMPFKYKGSSYDGSRYYRKRLSAPSNLGKPIHR